MAQVADEKLRMALMGWGMLLKKGVGHVDNE
jgi:hypothetical protein